MALDSTTSSERSESASARDRSSRPDRDDLSDRARDALSSIGDPPEADDTHSASSTAESAASQDRLAAFGREAQAAFERRQAEQMAEGVHLAQTSGGTLTDAVPGGADLWSGVSEGLLDAARLAGRAGRLASPVGAFALGLGVQPVGDRTVSPEMQRAWNTGDLAPADGEVVERRSLVDPALSAHSGRARGIVEALNEPLPQNWRAHHEIPFNVIAASPAAFQEALVAADWRMDSAENLAALPADEASYAAAPNRAALSRHNGAHPNYDAMVRGMLAPVIENYRDMSPADLRAAMNEIGDRAMQAINRFGDENAVERFHERLK